MMYASPLLFVCFLLGVLPHANGAETVKTAEELDAVYQQLIVATHWRDRRAAIVKLTEFGPTALPKILEGTEHENGDVRECCYKLLQDRFGKETAALAAVIRGLNDTHGRIAYSCAFHLGALGNPPAKQPLRRAMTNMKETDWSLLRYTLAKSLAELGETDVIRTLYHGLGSDSYMIRYVSNVGVAALTGRDLNNFDYDYGENAVISGGAEFRGQLRPIRDAELRASRFRAIAQFCRWLRYSRPEIYKELDPTDD